VDSILVDASAAYYVGFEAEDADSRWSGELNLMAVSEFQKQLTALGLGPCFEINPNKLQKPEKIGFHRMHLDERFSNWCLVTLDTKEFIINHQNMEQLKLHAPSIETTAVK
jgi:hypothetical protein